MSANRLRQLPGLLRTLAAPRRYADLPPQTRPARMWSALRRVLSALAALPSELRNAPPMPKDTGAGHTPRRERNARVIRPATGWRAHIGPPLHTNHKLGHTDEDN